MNCPSSPSPSSQRLLKTRYSNRHPTLTPSFVTSSFFQKDLFSNFCSRKGSPLPLPLLSIFLQKTLLVEAQFRAIATTTQLTGAEIVRCVFRLSRDLWNDSLSPTDNIAFNSFIYIMNACGALQTCAAILVILKLATIFDPRLVRSPPNVKPRSAVCG